jgi:hypothetical protein
VIEGLRRPGALAASTEQNLGFAKGGKPTAVTT